MWLTPLQAGAGANFERGFYEMSVYDFCYTCTDDGAIIVIYDMTTETEVFHDTMREAMFSDFCDYEVLSFDICPNDGRGISVILNICTDDE